MKNYLKKLGFFHWLLNRRYDFFSRVFIASLFWFICIIIFFINFNKADLKIIALFVNRKNILKRSLEPNKIYLNSIINNGTCNNI